MGLVAPADGFLDRLRARATRSGALLVFDEVITGFRLGRGGAQAHFGVTPDLSMFGKVVGGGFPLAALGGRADVMDALAPLGPVYQAGTLSGNPVATAAGLAVLSLLDDAAYVTLRERAARLETALREVFTATGTKAHVVRVETLTGLFFGVDTVRDYADAQGADHAAYSRFFHAMLDRGVFLPPCGYESMFVSLAHDDVALDAIVDAASHSVLAS
jgi:glutamate-1-semialdehyde 2,1-aminomutase